MRGEIEFRNELLPDLVIVRSDGRPTYNFVSPVDDIIDGITHVIRAEDHVSNTPSQINILRALGADLPVYAHVPNINGDDGKKLSKRHGALSVDVFRDDGYLPAALMNFLALLGWSYDDKTTIMSRHELIERFSLERVVPSPATFDYKKLDWMNGMYLRALQPDEYAHFLERWLREHDIDWPQQRVFATVPLVQEKIEKFSQYPDFVRFLFEDVAPPDGVDGKVVAAAADRLAQLPTVGGRRRSRRTCAGSSRSWGRSRGRRSRRSGSRSPARRSRRGCSRASSCSAATSRSGASGPRPPERLRAGERVECPLERRATP